MKKELLAALIAFGRRQACSRLARVILLLPFAADAATGDPDSFNPRSDGYINTAVVQLDGEILLGGPFLNVSSGAAHRPGVARYHADGTLDTTVLANGVGEPRAISLQDDGKILVGGSSLGGTRLYRHNPDGTLDTSFNLAVNVSGPVNALVVQPDGKILVGGSFTTIGGRTNSYLARLDINGTVETNFNPSPNLFVNSVALQPDGKILLGGAFLEVGGVARNFIARVNSNGTLDTNFTASANTAVDSLAVQADGKILLGGAFTSVNGVGRNHIARLNSDGTLDTNFTAGADASVESLALQADGKILLGGAFTNVNGVGRSYVARLNPNSTLDSLNPSVTGNSPVGAMVTSVALQADGKILLTGRFLQVGGQDRQYAARLQNDSATQSLTAPTLSRVQWLRGGSSPESHRVTFELSTNGGTSYTLLGNATRISGGWELTGLTLPAAGRLRARARVVGGSYDGSVGLVETAALFGYQPEVAVTGNGTNIADGASTPQLADHTEFGSFNVAGSTLVRTFTVTNSGNTNLALGAVTVSGAHPADFIVSAQPAITVATNSGTTFQITFNPTAPGLRTATLSFTNNDLGENPFNFNIQGTGLIATLSSLGLSPGTLTPAFTEAITNYSASVAYANTSLTVTAICSDTNSTLQMQLNGAGYAGLTSGSPSGALALNVGANTVNVRITAPDGTTAKIYTVAITRAAAVAGDLDPLDIRSGPPYSTTVQPDGKTIIVGLFNSVLGAPRTNIARLNADGTLDTGFNPTANGRVDCVAVQPDLKVLLGGFFTMLRPAGAVAATNRNRIARLNADGTLDTSFDPNANGAVHNLTVQPDGQVVIAGEFTTLQPNGGAATNRNRIARLNLDGTLDTGFDPNANGWVFTAALQTDGKVLLGGDFTTLQPNGAALATFRNDVARLNADGTLDTGFDPNANNFVNSVVLQADGKVLLGGGFTGLQPNGGALTNRGSFVRLQADGTLDTGFDPRPDGEVFSTAVQADGQVLLGGRFAAFRPNGSASTNRNRIARVRADGALDTGFDPNANDLVLSVALQADGKVLMGGIFNTLKPNGTAMAVPRTNFARLLNDPATQSLTAPSGATVSWTRGGSSPEVSQVTFELSTDGGVNWTALGTGVRVGVTPNWQLTGLALPGSGQLRARGRTLGGFYNGGSGLIESVASFSGLPAPEIAVRGNSVDIVDGDSTPVAADFTDFGSVAAASGSVVRTFTITNSGTANLALGPVALGGTHAAEFVVSAPPAASVSPNGSTTFQITFDPSATGLRTATVSISNNDAGENPFNFSIQGTGLAPEIAVSGNSVNIANGDNTPSVIDHTDFGGVGVMNATIVQTFTITNLGAASLTLGPVNVSGTHAADFVVSAPPAGTIGANGSTTFQITFDPGAIGLRTAAVSFSNNDADENPFNFSIQGTGLSPEIAVNGNGVDITDGDNTPSPADHTDFGSIAAASGTIVRTFTITNSGNTDLTLGNVTVSGPHSLDFTVTAQPTATVAPGGSTTFQVTFNPGAIGLRNAAILSFTNNDANENPFNFNLQGTGLNSAPPVIDLQGLKILGNGSFQFSFTNTNNVSFSVLAATNVSLPSSNWTVLGVATNAGGGRHQFTDSHATNFPRRLYHLRFP